MKLAIFGATGRTGIPLTEQALAAGHEVVALVRNPAKMPLRSDRLTVITGDALQPIDVGHTVRGADAVISVLGQNANKYSHPKLLTIATRNIIAAMRKYGVKRLVSLTGARVPAPQDAQSWGSNGLISWILEPLSGEALRDALGHAALIEQSPLDWVIVRVPRLRNGPRTGRYRVGWVGVNTSDRISRGDVVDFLLKEVTDNTHHRLLPMISD